MRWCVGKSTMSWICRDVQDGFVGNENFYDCRPCPSLTEVIASRRRRSRFETERILTFHKSWGEGPGEKVAVKRMVSPPRGLQRLRPTSMYIVSGLSHYRLCFVHNIWLGTLVTALHWSVEEGGHFRIEGLVDLDSCWSLCWIAAKYAAHKRTHRRVPQSLRVRTLI